MDNEEGANPETWKDKVGDSSERRRIWGSGGIGRRYQKYSEIVCMRELLGVLQVRILSPSRSRENLTTLR